jgi:hypothetical protein
MQHFERWVRFAIFLLSIFFFFFFFFSALQWLCTESRAFGSVEINLQKQNINIEYTTIIHFMDTLTNDANPITGPTRNGDSDVIVSASLSIKIKNLIHSK